MEGGDRTATVALKALSDPTSWPAWATRLAARDNVRDLVATIPLAGPEAHPASATPVAAPHHDLRADLNSLGGAEAVVSALLTKVNARTCDASTLAAAARLIGESVTASADDPAYAAEMGEALCTKIVALQDAMARIRLEAETTAGYDDVRASIDKACASVISVLSALKSPDGRARPNRSAATSPLHATPPPGFTSECWTAAAPPEHWLFLHPPCAAPRPEVEAGPPTLTSMHALLQHHRSVAHWLTRRAGSQLAAYSAEKIYDNQMRAHLDTERDAAESALGRQSRDLLELMQERISIEADRSAALHAADAEKDALAMAVTHEQGLQRLMEREQRQLQQRLDALRVARSSSENRVVTLRRRLDAATSAALGARDLHSERLDALEAGAKCITLQRWVGRLATAFIADVQAEAARLSASSLRQSERRLSAVAEAAASSVSETVQRAKDFVARLSSGRALLADMFTMSPLSSSTMADSEPSARGGGPTPSSHFPKTASETDVAAAGGGGSVRSVAAANLAGRAADGSQRDIAACGNDILVAMSRIAVEVEELHNRILELGEALREEDVPNSELDVAHEEASLTYGELAAMVDATRGDVLEQAYGDVANTTPRLPRRLESADDLADDRRMASTIGSVGAGKRGLPRKLARGRASATATVSTVADHGAHSARNSSTLSLDEGGAAHPPRNVESSVAAESWLSFIAQFRAAFGGELDA